MESVADFAITQIAFNPTGEYIACSSVANSVSLITLDEELGKAGWIRTVIMQNLYVVLAVVVFLLAVWLWMGK